MVAGVDLKLLEQLSVLLAFRPLAYRYSVSEWGNSRWKQTEGEPTADLWRREGGSEGGDFDVDMRPGIFLTVTID